MLYSIEKKYAFIRIHNIANKEGYEEELSFSDVKCYKFLCRDVLIRGANSHFEQEIDHEVEFIEKIKGETQ